MLPESRLPLPPRTPSFWPGEPRGVSGTAPKEGPPTHSAATTANAVVAPEGFPAQESVSFDKLLTPVVPAGWPENDEESVVPSADVEHTFWTAPPAYSTPPDEPFVELPPARLSWARSMLMQVLFMIILFGVAMLLCYEISVAYHLPWIDPRRLVARLRSG